MKNYIFYLFIKFYKNELSNHFIQKNFNKLILVKKGKIKEWRMYDKNHTRIYNFEINIMNKVIINPQIF